MTQSGSGGPRSPYVANAMVGQPAETPTVQNLPCPNCGKPVEVIGTSLEFMPHNRPNGEPCT